METFILIGEFAKLCHVTKRTLFYYDEIGLLKPAYTDEKGTRYYTQQQSDRMSTIKLFQGLGMSLSDIQELIYKESFTEKAAALEQQLQVVQQKIFEFQKTEDNLLFLARRLAILQKQGFDQLFCTYHDDEFYWRQARPQGELWLNAMGWGYQYGIIFSRGDFESYRWTFQKCIPEKANHIKPKGKYYEAFFLLKNEEILSCIPRFIAMIDLGLTQGDLYHEDYCSDIAGFSQQYIIKMSIRMRDV